MSTFIPIVIFLIGSLAAFVAVVHILLKENQRKEHQYIDRQFVKILDQLQFLEKKNQFSSEQLNEIKSSFKNIQASFFELEKKLTKPKIKK